MLGARWKIERAVQVELQAIDLECGTQFSKVLSSAETRGGFRLVCALVADDRATPATAALAYVTTFLHQNPDHKSNTQDVRMSLSAFATFRHLQGSIADAPFEVFLAQMRELNSANGENKETLPLADCTVDENWFTEEQLEEMARAIIELIQVQIAIAMEDREFEDSMLKIYRTGYIHGYLVGFILPIAEKKLADVGVPKEMHEANSDWIVKSVVGNLIDPDAAMRFETDRTMFVSNNSSPYSKGIRDGSHDGELVRDGKAPINFLAAEILTVQ